MLDARIKRYLVYGERSLKQNSGEHTSFPFLIYEDKPRIAYAICETQKAYSVVSYKATIYLCRQRVTTGSILREHQRLMESRAEEVSRVPIPN